jgi:hypothetical protein
LPSPADRRAVGLVTVLDVVLALDVLLDVLDDRAPDLADGRAPVPDCRGGMVGPPPLSCCLWSRQMPLRRDHQTAAAAAQGTRAVEDA